MEITRIHEQMVERLSGKKFKESEEFATAIRKMAGDFSIAPPKKQDLLTAYHSLLQKGRLAKNSNLEEQLKKREIRTLSGVAPIAVLTKPYFCPGRCAFCPTEAKMPKSYLSNEPAVMRAVLNKWDPYRQVETRLRAYAANGHATDKCELIVIGGTWSFLPKRYQTWYIKRLFDGLNGFTSKTLAEAQKYNETAKHRAVGMCLETRPDYITTDEVARMRMLGCTRVEIGLQTTDAEVLRHNKRGHGVETVKRATRLLREAGFKISYHLMPNLPGSDPEKDVKTFSDCFDDPGLKPDMVKIYPCVVVKDAEMYDWWRDGSYKPYDEETLFKTLLDLKRYIPEYCRVTRLIRDIPTTSIYGGNMRANLRQDILSELKTQGNPCRCIRCREPRRDSSAVDEAKLIKNEYETDGGEEIFMSYENNDQSTLYGFIRLRLPRDTHKKIIQKMPELKDAAIVRELHVYGTLVPLDTEGADKVQHRGLGKRLMIDAENEAARRGYKKIAVISGIGVRKYYEKIGYRLEGSYMVKDLKF